MCCVRRSSFRKVLASSALSLLLLSGAPLAAMEEKREAAPQAAAFGWLTDLWAGLTTWLTEAVVATPPPGVPPSQGTVDNGCAVDPLGGCGG